MAGNLRNTGERHSDATGGSSVVGGVLAGMAAVCLLGGCGSKKDADKTKTNPLAKQALDRAKKHEKTGDRQKAIDAYSEAIKADPKNTSAYGHRAMLYHDKGDRKKALADFSKVIELDPKSKQAYVRRGMVYNESGDPQGPDRFLQGHRTRSPRQLPLRAAGRDLRQGAQGPGQGRRRQGSRRRHPRETLGRSENLRKK